MSRRNLGINEAILEAYPHIIRSFTKSPVRYALLYIVGLLSLHIGLGVIFGGFSETPNIQDITDDPTFLPVDLVLGVSVYYYLVIPRLFSRALSVLDGNNIFISKPIVLNRRSLELLSSRRLTLFLPIAFAVGGIFIATLNAVFLDDIRYWNQASPISYVISMISFAVGWFSLGGVIANAAISIYLLQVVLRNNEIVVYPLHPDNSGGLGSLGQYALNLTNFALVVAALLVDFVILDIIRGRITSNYLLWLFVIAYLVCVPTLFYLTIRAAHNAMLDFRSRLLKGVATLYYQQHMSLHNNVPNDAGILKSSLQYLVPELDENV